MRTLTFLFLTVLVTASLAAEETRPPAYTAEMVITGDGHTTRMHVWSDGTTYKAQSTDGTSGRYTDYGRKLAWQFGPGYPCLQLPLEPEGFTSAVREEVVGSETIDGHPTKKVKLTTTINDGKKTTVVVSFEWRASDLHDLAVRRRGETGYESHLEHIVLGKPDAKLLSFPSSQCKYDESLDKTHDAPQAAGGFRSIRFSDASCKKLVSLPLMLNIPSDYEIRGFGNTHNCFWGAKDDLDRVLAREGPDFEQIHRGVFWCRVSESTEYDPVHEKFVSEQGTQNQWAKSMKSMGAKNVVVTTKKIGTIPSARVTASMNGQRVYMLYLAVPGADSPAILINYHPAGRGSAADDVAWQRFLESIEVVK